MQKSKKLMPSVLTDNSEELSVSLGALNEKYERAMLTIVDGIFADNLSVAIEDLASMGVGPDLEIHLAVEYPVEYLGGVASVGASKVWAQVERMGRVSEFVEVAGELSLSPRVALDVFTPVAAIEKRVWQKIDGVMVFGNRAGLPVAGFDPRVLVKVGELRERGFEGEIGAGVVMEEAQVEACWRAGAEVVLVGQRLWNNTKK